MLRSIVALVISDVGAYAYHRAAHQTDVHMRHHDAPEDISTIATASVASGAFVSAASYATRMGCVPVMYWVGVTAMHPLLHHNYFRHWPMSYVQTRHAIHHEHPHTNFGPFTPFMDRLCGTEFADTSIKI